MDCVNNFVINTPGNWILNLVPPYTGYNVLYLITLLKMSFETCPH